MKIHSKKHLLSSHMTKEMLHVSRLIIVTNRGPVEYYLSKENILKQRRGSGGVVTALMSISNSMPVTWVAMAMTEGDRVAVRQADSPFFSFRIANAVTLC